MNAYAIAAEVLQLEIERDKARGEVVRLERELKEVNARYACRRALHNELRRELNKKEGALEERRAIGAANIEALDRIQVLLSGTEWNTMTISDVADVIRTTGRAVEEVV